MYYGDKLGIIMKKKTMNIEYVLKCKREGSILLQNINRTMRSKSSFELETINLCVINHNNNRVLTFVSSISSVCVGESCYHYGGRWAIWWIVLRICCCSNWWIFCFLFFVNVLKCNLCSSKCRHSYTLLWCITFAAIIMILKYFCFL